MALNRYFTVRKRPATGINPAPAKRRKLTTEDTRLDVREEPPEQISVPSTKPDGRRAATRASTKAKATKDAKHNPESRLPAYKRFAHLTEPVGPSPSATLPPTSPSTTSTNRHRENQLRAERSSPVRPSPSATLPPTSPSTASTNRHRENQLRAERSSPPSATLPPTSTNRHRENQLRAEKSSPVRPSPSATLPPTSPSPTSTNCHRENQLQAKKSFPQLATSTDALPTDLPLPRKYQLLAERFRCTDTVVNMLQKRKETCTFEKLKQAVQEMTRRNFQEHNLSQMKTVHPRAFTFRQEKNIPGIYDRRRYKQYQLTVECVTEDGGVEEGKSQGSLNPTAMVKRRKVFHHNLTQIVRNHHQSFLSSLDPPLSIPEEKVLRWHPAFPLEHIPDVEPATLPRPPVTETYTTARDVLNVARSNMAPRVKQALAGVAAESEAKGERGKVPMTGGSEPEEDPALRGIPKALLEKIRQKEAARAEAAITRDPLKEKRLEMIARLPEFCRIMRIFFVAEKKAAIPWDSVVQKLCESSASGLPPAMVEEHLLYLQELAPEFLKCVIVRKCNYIKLQKDKIKAVAAILQRTKKELGSP